MMVSSFAKFMGFKFETRKFETGEQMLEDPGVVLIWLHLTHLLLKSHTISASIILKILCLVEESLHRPS
jgi:hypothetical protein